MRLRTRRLSTQILGGQVIVLIVAGGIGFAFSKRAVRQLVDHQYEQRALAVAETTAAMPTIRTAMANGDPDRAVAGLAEQVISRTGASYVVVIDRNRIRHSHPIPALIGQPVSEPLVVLDGRGHVGLDPHGSLGPSANGKAPIFGPDGKVIGEVSAGLLENRVSSEAAGQLPSLAAYALVALAGGIVVASALARRLKRQTFGLELDEIAALLQDREATLHGIREGVVALDPAGRVSLINDQAHLLLHTPPNTAGRPVTELFPAGRLLDLLVGKGSGHDQVVLFGDRLLVVNRMPVNRRGKDLGTVVTLRDRTELEQALRELDDVRGFTDALRAQQHEFSNRMHVIAGLLELGRYQEAESFVSQVSGATAGLAAELETRISSPLVIALLVAKTTVAIERGVTLTVTGESRLDVDAEQANALVSIIGNLVDNAIDAAAGNTVGPVAAVTVRFLQDAGSTVVEVADTGPGIPAEIRDFIFTDGWSTKAAPGGRARGLGLALVRQIAERMGGDISVAEGSGAVLRVTLPRRPVAVDPVSTTIRTLIVDDDFQVATIHADYVERVDKFTVAGVAHTAAAAAEAVQQLHPDLILLDLYLPDEGGLSLLARLRDGPGPHPDVIAITAARDVASVRSAMKLGAFHYLVKPFRFSVLAERLDAYRRLWERTNRMKEADQQDVDSLFGLLRASDTTTPPKGDSAPTLALVREVFQDGDAEWSAAEVASQVGISRPTAQRYLAHLVRSGLLELHLRYGTAGRPEHRYRRGR